MNELLFGCEHLHIYLNDKYCSIREKIEKIPRGEIRIPAIMVAELYFGAMKNARREHNLARYSLFISTYGVVPFDHAASRRYGYIRTDLESKGLLISDHDIMIAASALVSGAVLVTPNTKEISRVNGLVIED